MKGRSHRLPQAEAADDWGDGSWTVDCSCGVTFDDGEEMVSCDECGVWVHTRCSRFIRGEASFACHNCKAATRRLRSAGHLSLPDDTEETEVAKLLVELPTKTDNCLPPPSLPSQHPASAPPPQRRRLWGEIPLKDRVHVQGVPGGEPGLFGGLSSVFTSQLWKCTGYVPKKLNFQYKEFPCWGEEDGEEKKKGEAVKKGGEEEKEGAGKKEGEEDGENPANRGADVLFSLSKEIMSYAPLKTFHLAVKHEEAGKAPSGSRSLSCRKKDRSRLSTAGQANAAKKRKEEPGETKDWSGRKKARSIADKLVGDNKRRGSVPFFGTKKLEFHKDKVLQVEETSTRGLQSEDQGEETLSESYYAGQPRVMGCNDKAMHLQADNNIGLLSEKRLNEDITETQLKVEKLDQMETVKNEKSSKMGQVARGGSSHSARVSTIDEVSGRAIYCLKQPKDDSNFEDDLVKSSSHAITGTGTSNELLSGFNDGLAPTTKLSEQEIKDEASDHLSTGYSAHSASHCPPGKLLAADSQQPGPILNQLSESFQDRENKPSFPSHGNRSQNFRRECNELKEGMTSRTEEPKKRRVESAENEGSLEVGHVPKICNEGTNSKHRHLNKLVPDDVAVGATKDSSAISPAISKLSVSVTSTSATKSASSSGKVSHLTKQTRAKVNTYSAPKKECGASPTEENVDEGSKNPAKCQTKGSQISGSKPSQKSRTPFSSTTDYMISDSKELPFQISKASSKVDGTAILRPDYVTGSGQSQVASGQINIPSSSASQRTEKSHQPAQSTGKLSTTSMLLHPSASSTATATLSDEELALLLHQELNSSPRVPRVPRMRQASGAQLSSSTGMSVLSKRPVSGGKDQVSVFRRKNKEDILRDVTRNSQELNDETRKKGRLPPLPDYKRQQSSITTDMKKESQNRTQDLTLVRNVPLAPSEGGKSDPLSSEISEHNTSAVCSSPGDGPRDDGSVAARTLPGLIDEIMSKDKHITYEELCDAVRPHWRDLRKPNGERYAYPSYLHAVHDCLRNRSEWVHLIDQGPKTNSSKKRRKVELDSDVQTIESENEKTKTRYSKEEENGVESHREDVPKGKRNARKRRRPELRGTSTKDKSTRRGRGAVSDYYTPAFSHSSNEGNESFFSEDESRGAAPHGIRTQTSSSSSDDSS